jgi:hypothetical protein
MPVLTLGPRQEEDDVAMTDEFGRTLVF